MTFRVGDVLFGHNGFPGIVDRRSGESIVDEKGELTKSSTLSIDQDRKEIRKQHRHGYVNGLSDADRQSFLTLLDKVKEQEDPSKRVEELKGMISELRKDPAKWTLANYLTSEMAHLMNSFGIKARTYEIDPSRVR